MATDKQKRYSEIRAATDLSKKKAALKAGYSETMADNPQQIENSDGFQDLMESIDEKGLIDIQEEIAKDKSDKRASTAAFKELMKLKKRYPKHRAHLTISKEQDEIVE